MSKTTKILLGLSVTGLTAGMVFVTGLVNVESLAALYVALPAGAIFFGLFLISFMLEKESALFDSEQRQHLADATRVNSAGPVKECCSARAPASLVPAKAR